MLKGVEQNFWLLWSMKESAFKAVVQAGRRDIRFNPMDFVLAKFSEGQEKHTYAIDCNGYSFTGYSVCTPSYVYSLSYSPGMTFVDAISETVSDQYREQSGEVRALACEAYSQVQQIDAAQVSTGKDEDQIPFFTINQVRQATNLTFSHHGRFLAYAFSL